jgi:hypothetical protein
VVSLLRNISFINSKKLIVRHKNVNVFFIIFEISLLLFFFFTQSENLQTITNIQTCGNYELTGLKCSTCGVTRSIYSFLNLNFLKSIHYNWIGFILCILFILEILIRIYCLISEKYFNYHVFFYFFCFLLIFICIILNFSLLNL